MVRKKFAVSPSRSGTSSSIPRPFRPVPGAFEPFVKALSKDHIYITHIDNHPRAFKRKIFLVPVVMNVLLAALFIWYWARVQGPWYLSLFASFAGAKNETTVIAEEESYHTLFKVVLTRSLWFLFDLTLFIFVWPWPLEFFLGAGTFDSEGIVGNKGGSASPAKWRIAIGFRDKEIVVRKSRSWGKRILFSSSSPANRMAAGKANKQARLDFLKPEGDSALARGELLNTLRTSTSPRLVKEKTGYLTMDAQWDLSFSAMILAHKLVDMNVIAIEAFTLVALVYHDLHGWLVVDVDGSSASGDGLHEQRRNDVFRFRDALTAVGKEDLFYRWIELVQFESTRPEGFGKERQEVVAKQIRDMFAEHGIDFDEFWQEAVGRESARGV